MSAAAPLQVKWTQWDCPENVKACTTLRHGGVSEGVYASLNLGAHVGDDSDAVFENRKRLKDFLQLPNEPIWMSQVHGTRIIDAASAEANEEADGAITHVPGVVCAVMTADCLALFLCDQDGSKIGLFHVGWRGLASGMVEHGVKQMGIASDQLHAWMGPTIGPEQFEIDAEVREQLGGSRDETAHAFQPSVKAGHWLADLYTLTRLRLQNAGVSVIGQSSACTKSDAANYFSHRRDGICGRMASLIWLTE